MHLANKPCFDDQSLFWLSVSSGVRITQQGFLFLSSPAIHGPETYPCPRTLGALCAHGNYTFLPCTDSPRTMLTDAPPPFDRFWAAETRCAKIPTLYNFDVLPCDLRNGASVLWANGVVSVQYDRDLAYWPNLFVLLIMVWLIVNLGESIALILEVKGSERHHHSTVALCVALVLIVGFNTPSELWATREDWWLYWGTIVYIGAYALYHLENPNTINVIVGCMVLVSARFYQTFETPYAATFLFLTATRLVQKLYGVPTLKGALWAYARAGFMLADAGMFIALYSLAFVPAFGEVVQAHLYLEGLLFAAWCLGSFVAGFVRSKARK
jgi:hypothetical protein